jgi:protein phosphatase
MAFANHCVVAWMGDSRVYRLRGQQFAQMTRDHSEVEELIVGAAGAGLPRRSRSWPA